MKLPGGERAIADLVKIRDYCLNPLHPRGRHKARVFRSSLGIVAADAEWLREHLLQAAREGEALEGFADDYGRRYIVDFEASRAGRRANVRSSWIIRRGDEIPRLTSCWVLSE